MNFAEMDNYLEGMEFLLECGVILAGLILMDELDEEKSRKRQRYRVNPYLSLRSTRGRFTTDFEQLKHSRLPLLSKFRSEIMKKLIFLLAAWVAYLNLRQKKTVVSELSGVAVMDLSTATFYDPKEQIWFGPKKKELYNENITLGEVIYEMLRKNPNKIIQIHDQTGETLTCKELQQYSRILSLRLIKMGLRPGDIIGLYANNWTHASTVVLSSFLCAAPVNAWHPDFDKETVLLLCKITSPKILFCELENYAIAQSVLDELNLKIPIYVMNGDQQSVPHIRDLLCIDEGYDLNKENFRFPCLDLKGQDTAMILCSSGTTGTPKGVLCSHQALLNQNVYLTQTSDSVLFSFSTMYWISGVWNLVNSLLNASLRIVTCQTFSPQYFLYLVRQYKITHLAAGVNHIAELTMYGNLSEMQKSLESIDTLIVGGSKVPLSVQEKMSRYLARNKQCPGFCVAYGMTELANMLTVNSGYPKQRLESSEGKLMANTMVRIICKDGGRLGPMEHGEICICMPYPWKGYLNNPEATIKAQRNGWLYTGDIGYFDEQGFLHVCARDNDVFKSKNFQIYPQLIEDVVLRIPGIKEACVFGIPDFVASHLTAGAVVRAGNKDGQQLTAKEIDQHVKAHMGSMYHLSGGVYFIEDIPKTGSGKAQRHKVLELVLKMREV